MNCIKFDNRIWHELRKEMGILKIYNFFTFIHKCRFLDDFENNKNNDPKYFRP